MTGLLWLLPVLAVLFTLSGILGHYDSRVRRHGIHALVFRGLTAHQNWAGKNVTNRGWLRPGTKALTPTGHAHRRWFWPGWQHCLWRVRNTVLSLLVCTALLFRFRSAVEYLAVTAAAGAAYGAWRT